MPSGVLGGGTIRRMPSKVPFSELSPPGKAVTAVLIALSLLLVVTAERDLQHRPAQQIRGRKLLWRLASLNALGAVGYLRFGRRAPADSAR